jgi:hypothetical protein
MAEIFVVCEALCKLIGKVTTKIITFNMDESNSIVNLNRQIQSLAQLISSIQQNPHYSGDIQETHTLMKEVEIWIDTYAEKSDWKKNPFSHFFVYDSQIKGYLKRLQDIQDRINTQVLLDEYLDASSYLQEGTHENLVLQSQLLGTVEKRKALLSAMETQKKIFEESRTNIESIHNQILQDMQQKITSKKKEGQHILLEQRMNEIYHLITHEQQEIREKVERIEMIQSETKIAVETSCVEELIEAKKKLATLEEKKITLKKKYDKIQLQNQQHISQKLNDLQTRISNMQSILSNLEKQETNNRKEMQTLYSEKQTLTEKIKQIHIHEENLVTSEGIRNGKWQTFLNRYHECDLSTQDIGFP